VREPIVEFKSIEAARAALKEWQHRLYLDDWIISLQLVDGTEIPGNRGLTDICFTHKSAVIKIAKLNEDIRSRIVRQCQETTLVHELLHCKYDTNFYDNTHEGRYMEAYEHAHLEQMARSLIMAKYGVGPEWFDNVDWSE
jgi:hypothetical protein